MAVTGNSYGAGRDIPPLHDLLQEAIFDKAFPINPAAIARPDGNDAPLLQAAKSFKGSSAVFPVGSNMTGRSLSIGYPDAPILGVCAVSIIGNHVTRIYRVFCRPKMVFRRWTRSLAEEEAVSRNYQLGKPRFVHVLPANAVDSTTDRVEKQPCSSVRASFVPSLAPANHRARPR